MRKNVLKHPTDDYVKMVPGMESKMMEKMLESVLEDKSDAAELFNRMGSVKVLERLLFKSYHKALLPLVLALQKFSEEESLDDKKAITGIDKVLHREKDNYEDFRTMNFEQAYDKLVKSQPTSEIEREVKDFMLKVINRSKKKTNLFNDLLNLVSLNKTGNKVDL